MEFLDLITTICYVICGWYVGRTQEALIYNKKLKAEAEVMEEMLLLVEACTKEMAHLRETVKELMEEYNDSL